jgi:hypothetical protein
MAATNLPSIRCTGSSLVSFVRSVNTPFYLNLLCKATDINGFLLDGQSNIITGSMFNAVPGTNGEWMYAKISTGNLPNLNTLIPDGQNTTVSNTSGQPVPETYWDISPTTRKQRYLLKLQDLPARAVISISKSRKLLVPLINGTDPMDLAALFIIQPFPMPTLPILDNTVWP